MYAGAWLWVDLRGADAPLVPVQSYVLTGQAGQALPLQPLFAFAAPAEAAKKMEGVVTKVCFLMARTLVLLMIGIDDR